MDPFTDKVDAIFTEWDKPDSPGCALTIIRDGVIVFQHGYGVANLEHDVPITSKTVFDIGSTSKQFTALCVVLLRRDGKLSLDDDVREYIPEMPAYKHPITIRNLIHHTSGIRDYLTLMDLAGMRYENEYSDEEIIGLICRQKELNFEPGEEYLYSNSGYLLLAEIVKRVSGISLRNFADEWIFEPLGMTRTHFHDDLTEIVKNRAAAYSSKGEDGYQIEMSISDVVGDGCVYTTVEDLYLWDQNFYHNIIGGYGNDLIDEITTTGKLNNGELQDYAFGLIVEEYKGLKMIYHDGGWGGYRSDLIRFPEQRFSVICLANLAAINPSGLAKKVADLYLSDQFTKQLNDKFDQNIVQPVELPEVEIQSKAGFYRDPKAGIIWELSLDDGKLFAEVSDMRFQLVPTSPSVFSAIGIPYTVVIEFDQQGRNDSMQMQVSVDEGKPDQLFRIRPEPVAEDALRGYEGLYTCEELDVNYYLKFEDSKLILRRKGLPEEVIKPINKDLFKGSDFSLQFIRIEELDINGFYLCADRVINLRFIKPNSS